MKRALLLIAAAAVVVSCSALGKLRAPEEAWVRAERATYDVIAPAFRAYVEADGPPEGMLDAETQKLYLDLVADWNLRIATHEAAEARR